MEKERKKTLINDVLRDAQMDRVTNATEKEIRIQICIAALRMFPFAF